MLQLDTKWLLLVSDPAMYLATYVDGRLSTETTTTTFANVKCNFYCSQLKMGLDKNDTVRKSDWGTEDISAAQQSYAATDAYVSKILHTNTTFHCGGVNDICKGKMSDSKQKIIATNCQHL
jgi:hypothetical protein